MKKIFYRTILLLGLAGTLSSCGEWLDVQPKTSIEQDDLFSQEYGFKDALTGFYIKMGETGLYAQNLTYGYLDLLAGLYTRASILGIYDMSTLYAFDGAYQSTVNQIYAEMYNIIANINNFLHFIDVKRDVITTPDYYETMKGEALGLRAFLHFDLLRMFGPVYAVHPESKAVPYRTQFNHEATPILSAREVLDLCIADLLEAEELLEEHDSQIFNYDDTADPFTEMRQMRMNIWAVKAMLARTYLYKGDAGSKELALDYALQVIESGKFTLADRSMIGAYPNMPSEHIFALSIFEYYSIVDPIFVDPDVSTILSATKTQVETWYEGSVDSRRQVMAPRLDQGGQDMVVLTKYDQGKYSSARDNYSGYDAQPLIRLSEMYYIAAECESDPETAADYLDEVISLRTGRYDVTLTQGFDQRDTRQIYGITTGQTVRTNELMKEYLKEFYGEGQLFYFYKRHNFTTFSNCPLTNTDMTSHYQMPLPDDEYTFGNNN